MPSAVGGPGHGRARQVRVWVPVDREWRIAAISDYPKNLFNRDWSGARIPLSFGGLSILSNV
jgi:hypothetical protein